MGSMPGRGNEELRRDVFMIGVKGFPGMFPYFTYFSNHFYILTNQIL